MLVAIAGGALQGVEVAYLAKKAGFETLLLDEMPHVPASGICDSSTVLDLTDPNALARALDSVKLVVPATENPLALRSLVEWCESNEMPLAFDLKAFALSSSKKSSNALFQRLGMPFPTPWPDCSFPVLAKPDRGSGSRGVEVFTGAEGVKGRFGASPPQDRVLQEYLPGPSYSIEVMGRPGHYTALQVTELEMDGDFDCKRVLAPSLLPPPLIPRLEAMAVELAQAVELAGIMDVEVIPHLGQLKILEIDARFPSQTPSAVFHSTGVNMVERLSTLFVEGEGRTEEPGPRGAPAGSVLQHIRVGSGRISVCGERVMKGFGPLHLVQDFFGADEALTSYAPDGGEWVATLMVRGSDRNEAMERRDQVIRDIQTRFSLNALVDESPQGDLETRP